MAVSLTSSDAVLKTLWPQSRVEDTVYADHPLFAMMPKMESFYGKNLVLAVRYADTQGRSTVFSIAQANAGAFASKAFTLTRVKDYQVCQLDSETIEATENDKGALISALDTELESGFSNLSRSLATSLYGNGSGALGQGATITDTNTITLANIDDIAKFEVGMMLVAGATETGDLRGSGSGDNTPVLTIDRDLGTFTILVSDISSLGATDYYFVDGDGANNSGVLQKVTGLLGWLPTTAPTATTFFGMDRSVDKTRLGGLRIDCTGLNPEEAVVTVLSKQSREGGRPSHFMCNHRDFRGIEISIGSKVEYETASVGNIGFTGIKIIGPKGPVTAYADQDCSSGRAFSLQMNTWKLYSLKKAPRIFDRDGNKLSRVYNADSWEARIGYFAQLGCTFPGANANVTMPA